MKWIFLAILGLGTVNAESRRVELMQEVVKLDAMERRTVLIFPLRQQGARLELKFASRREGEGVRVAIYDSDSNVALAGTPYAMSDLLRTPLESGREYRVEVENLRQRLGHAVVDVEATLVFGDRATPAAVSEAKPLEPRRRLYTILTSLTIFAVIMAYAAVQLGPPLLERWRGER